MGNRVERLAVQLVFILSYVTYGGKKHVFLLLRRWGITQVHK